MRQLATEALLRRTRGAVLATIISASMLVACSDSPDPHDEEKPETEWSITNTSEELDSQVIVHNPTGIEYIAIVFDEDSYHVYGYCERYDSDGNIMHDGDPTNGGPFGLEFVQESSDESGTTKIFRDRQTGIAYRWHEWQSNKRYIGQGLAPCRDEDGNIQRWDDNMLISIKDATTANDTGDTGTSDDVTKDETVIGMQDSATSD